MRFRDKYDIVKDLVLLDCQEYSMKYIYSTSQMSKLSLTLHTFSVTGSVAGLFLILMITLTSLDKRHVDGSS